MCLYAPLRPIATGGPDMNAQDNYDLDSGRGMNSLLLDMYMGIITPKEVAYLLKGHPREDEFWAYCPQLRFDI